ncbi:signal peptidase I [Clostridium aciditolerans]|uniref:Signal peptidase I n=1 Tax=Clostridium aciditolerans TaxID=339861 RepID=A0A934M209_9CLOT|nr:signal peptidase I [Clostridium aciditolerans]MBI6871425.1 signal peptidase I [Clostridium aciditolerans]
MNNQLAKEIKEYAISIIAALFIALLFHNYVFARATVEGPSMQPTLHNKDILFLEKISTETSNVKRGQIVVFDSKNENGDYYIKRVIGVAGDIVEIKNGHVYLNGNMLNENYLSANNITEPLSTQSRYTVPSGYVFVLGDNRTNSIDSRILGPINLKDLKGHAVIRVFPFDSIEMF